jgi:hypothetical protein
VTKLARCSQDEHVGTMRSYEAIGYLVFLSNLFYTGIVWWRHITVSLELRLRVTEI